MRRFGLLVTTAACAAVFAMPAPSGADPTGACPDDFLLFPAATDRDMDKDRNNNGLVCRKVNDQGQPIGGPDDTIDDIIVGE